MTISKEETQYDKVLSEKAQLMVIVIAVYVSHIAPVQFRTTNLGVLKSELCQSSDWLIVDKTNDIPRH